VAANSLYGMILGGGQYDTHGSVNTQVINNIIVNNEAFGISLSYATGSYANTTIDHNLYYANGWRPYNDGGMWQAGTMVIREGGSYDPYQTVAEVQANTPWEDHGVSGDPAFWDYDPDDHDLHDGSWPNFHLTPASTNAIDGGTTVLPNSLAALLEAFDLDDHHWGMAFDVGRYEAGFAILPTPSTQTVEPGGTAHYALHLYPSSLPHNVALTAASPSPSLTLALDPLVVSSDAVVTLTITDTHTGSVLVPGLRYTVPITGTGGGFVQTTSVNLLVGGRCTYLPLVIRER
jgi:hypothetical protein